MLQPDNGRAQKPSEPPSNGTHSAETRPSLDAQCPELRSSQLRSPHTPLTGTQLRAIVDRCERLLGETENGEVINELGDRYNSRLIQLEGAGWLARIKSRLEPERALSRALAAMDELGMTLELTQLSPSEISYRALDSIGLYGASLLDRPDNEMGVFLKAARVALERTVSFRDCAEETYSSIGIHLHRFVGALIANEDLGSLEELFSMQLNVQLQLSLLSNTLYHAQRSGDKSILESIEPLLRRAYQKIEIDLEPMSIDFRTNAFLISAKLDASLGYVESAFATLRSIPIDNNIVREVGVVYGINAARRCGAHCTDGYDVAQREILHAFGLINSDTLDQREQRRQSFFWGYCDGIAIGNRLAGSQAAVPHFLRALLTEFPEIGFDSSVWTKVIALLTMDQPEGGKSTFLLKNLERRVVACENFRELREVLCSFTDHCLRDGPLPPGCERDNLAQGLVNILGSMEKSWQVTSGFTPVFWGLKEAGYEKLALRFKPDLFCDDLGKLSWIILRHHIDRPGEALNLKKDFDTAMLDYLASIDDKMDKVKESFENDDPNGSTGSRDLAELLVSLVSRDRSATANHYAHRSLDLFPELMRHGYIEQSEIFLSSAQEAIEYLSGWDKENLVRRICETLWLGVEAYLEEYPRLAVAVLMKHPD